VDANSYDLNKFPVIFPPANVNFTPKITYQLNW